MKYLTEKEKAKELFDEYEKILFKELEYGYNKNLIIKIILKVVDNIIDTGLLLDSSVYVKCRTSIEYWQYVKIEIEKL